MVFSGEDVNAKRRQRNLICLKEKHGNKAKTEFDETKPFSTYANALI